MGKREIPGFQFIDGRRLAAMEFQPLEFVVDGLLPVGGCAIIAAPPKAGKSFLCQDIALSVALGRPVMGRSTRKGKVLYLALEDGYRRLQARQERILEGLDAPDSIHYAVTAEKINSGLQEQITGWKQTFPDGTLVVIDIFQRVRPESPGNREAYQLDYAALAPLNDLARELSVAICIIHHTRKQRDDENTFLTISGSNGLFGAVTVAMVLERKEGEEEAVLHTTGKDIEGEEIKLRFNRRSFRFEPVLPGGAAADPVVLLIQREVQKRGGAWQTFTSALPEAARNYSDLSMLHNLTDVRIGSAVREELQRRGISATHQRNKPWYFSIQ